MEQNDRSTNRPSAPPPVMSQEDSDMAAALRAMAARCRDEAENASDASVQRELRVIASRCKHLAEKIENERAHTARLR